MGELAPLTYLKIETNMRRVMERLDQRTTEFAATSDARALATAAYDIARAKARLEIRYKPQGESKVRVTEQVADDHATLATEVERKAYEIAKAKNESAKQSMLNLRSQLDGLRSLMSSYRSLDGGS